MKKYILILTVAMTALFTGCDKGGKDEDKDINVPNHNELKQSAYADEEIAGSVTFTADLPWEIDVKQTTWAAQTSSAASSMTRAQGLPWLSLDRYEGPAGKFTVTISLETNYSRIDRKAEIYIEAGNTIVTVEVTQSGKKENGEFPVQQVPVQSVTLNKTSLTMVPGDTETLFAIVQPSNATEPGITWSSDNPSVASVDGQTGEITAIAQGTANITAVSVSDETKKATCEVTVNEIIELKRIKKIEITSTNPDMGAEVVSAEIAYDALSRVKSVVNQNFDGSGTVATTRYSYESPTKVTGTYVYTNSDGPGTGSFTMTLNENGWVFASSDKYGDDETTESQFEYTAGYLSKVTSLYEVMHDSSEGSSPVVEKEKDVTALTWNSGNLTRIKSGIYSDPDSAEGARLTYNTLVTAEYGNYRNDANLDMAFITGGLHFFSAERGVNLTGGRSANLISKTASYGWGADSAQPSEPFETVNYTYEFSGGYVVRATLDFTSAGEDGQPVHYRVVYAITYE